MNRLLAVGGGSVRTRQSPESSSRAVVRQNQSIFKNYDDNQRKIFEATKRYEVANFRQSLRNIEAKKKEEIKAIVDVNRAWTREQKAARATFARSIGTGAAKGAGAIAAVGKAGLTTLGVGGSVLAGTAVHEAMKLDEMTRRLVVNARGPGEAGADPEALRKKIVSAGLETGIAPEQIAGGAMRYVAKTGDLTTATENLKNFATVAQATGSSVEDVASTAADLAQKFDIKSAKDMGDALAVLAFQGKKGAFELKDMAEQFPEMAAAAQRAGLKGVGGMRTLGGLAQIARQSTGSGAEASTALQMMLTQLTTKAGDLHSGKALGGKRVDVFQGGDPTKSARDLPTVIAEVISRSHGNMTELAKLFDVRGIRAVSPMIDVYRKAADSTKGTSAEKEKAGYEAIIGMIKDASESSGKFSDVQKDAVDVQKSSTIQLETAILELKQAFANELMPEVKQLIPHVRDLTPVFRMITQEAVGLAKFLSEHPFAGIGAVMAASISAELAKAQLAQLVSAGVVTPLGAAGLAATALTASFLAAKAYIDGKFAQGDQKADDAAKSAAEINDKAQSELERTGKISPETAKQLAALDATQRKTLAGAEAVGKEGYLDYAGRALQQVSGGKHNIDEYAALAGAGASQKYTDETVRTRQLMTQGNVAKVEGSEDLKAAARELAKSADVLSRLDPFSAFTATLLNRTNSPSPVKG